jgi:hypothetical protein
MVHGDVRDPALARIRQLIASGEAVDEEDAREALQEEEDVELFRTTEPTEHRERLDRALANPETDPIDRQDFKFRKAVVETGEMPDELEFLWYQALLDLPVGETQDQTVRRRRESTRRRLTQKADRSAARIGRKRVQELFELYRIALQKLFDEP